MLDPDNEDDRLFMCLQKGKITKDDLEVFRQAEIRKAQESINHNKRILADRGVKYMTIREKLSLDNVSRMLGDVQSFATEIIQKDIPTKPTLLSEERAKFRVKFLTEEAFEFADAWDNNDLNKAADALVDSIYVALDGLIEMGITPGIIFDEVHQANMKKRRGKTKRGSETDAFKPEGWTPPDHSWLTRVSEDDMYILKNKPNVPCQLIWNPILEKPKVKFSDLPDTSEVLEDKPIWSIPLDEEDLAFENSELPKHLIVKPTLTLIPYEAQVVEAQAMAYGRFGKYKLWDWIYGRKTFLELMDSCKHHINAWLERQTYDPESGVHHLGMAKANLSMGIALEAIGDTKLDDRRPVKSITYHKPDKRFFDETT